MVKKGRKTEFGTKVQPFYNVARSIFRLFKRLGIGDTYFQKTGAGLKAVYSGENEGKRLEEYISYKLMNVIIFFFAGCILFAVYTAFMDGGNSIASLERQGVWGEDEQRQVIAEIDGTEELLDITVRHREYQEDRLMEILHQKAEELPDIILGENCSVDSVSSDLNLVSQIPGTEIDVYWEIEENAALLFDGTVLSDKLPKEALPVQLTAELRYFDSSVTTQFFVNLVSPRLSSEEQLVQAIKEKISEENDNTVSESSLMLPTRLEGRNITYRQAEGENSRWIVAGLFLACMPLMFFAQDEKLHKKRQQRENQMKVDYPEIVNKLTLYLGAGMTIPGAFEKIAANYIQQRMKNRISKRFAYEEIVYFCRELQGGISIRAGIENFSERCQLQSYRKLSMLLLQNLKKGSGELLELLRKEAFIAFEDRKGNAKRLGEEAGTKMLFPMAVMLCIVLVVLVVPAWLSFGA